MARVPADLPSTQERQPPDFHLQDVRSKLQAALRGPPCRMRLSPSRLDGLAWDCWLVLCGVRAACLVDSFSPTTASTRCLAEALADLQRPGSDTVALVVHEPSEQLFVVNRSLTLDRCRQVMGSERDGPLWFVDARPNVAAGTLFSKTPASLRCLVQELHDRLPRGNIIRIGKSQEAADGISTLALEGVALAGFLLEYPCIYTLANEDGPLHDAEGNNLSDVPLTHFRVMLSESEDSGELPVILQFTVPSSCLDPSRMDGKSGEVLSVAGLKSAVVEKIEARLSRTSTLTRFDDRRRLREAQVRVVVTEVSQALVGL